MNHRIELKPCAKINIGLNITEKRPDGYHNLESIFYPIPLFDKLKVEINDNSSEPYHLQLDGRSIEGNADDNLVVKVLNMVKLEFDIPSVNIYLKKNIPTGAGLGGGSSDAASMMVALNMLFNLGLSEEDMQSRVEKIGADCAFFIQSVPAYAEGIGNILSPSQVSLRGKFMVLVKPEIFISTKEAYQSIVPQKTTENLQELIQQPIEQWKVNIKNDFEEGLFRTYPQIAQIKRRLYEMGASYASMSGSGSAVFGLFDAPVKRSENDFNNCFVFSQNLIV